MSGLIAQMNPPLTVLVEIFIYTPCAKNNTQIVVTVVICDENRLNSSNTVKPPNKGHTGDRPLVPCRKIVLLKIKEKFNCKIARATLPPYKMQLLHIQ